MNKRVVALLTIATVVFTYGVAAPAAASTRVAVQGEASVGSSLTVRMNQAGPSQLIPVIVTMRSTADLSRLPTASTASRQTMAIKQLKSAADAGQAESLAALGSWQTQGLITDLRRFWIFDGFSFRATPAVISALAARSDVASVVLDGQISAPPVTPALAAPSETNISLINAPSMWSMGYSGQGQVVATMDTGVDMTNPDLAATWRGGSDSWYDPNGQHTSSPVDLNGHGTKTLGVLVGGQAGGTAIGVAPGAKWISVKIFDDAGAASVSGIHAGFQWLLDPDNNPATADAPNVVNNSWTFANPGCDLTFQPDIQALVAAGILPVFAAGNGGPSANTSFSPGNNAGALAVGATDNSDQIASFSSLGPTTCGGSSGVFPDMTAPGVGINTADLYGYYTLVDGTSIAAPQVAGALALLLQAFPGTSVADQQAALQAGAVDLGVPGPDDVYGNGRLDILASYNWLAARATPQLYLSISAAGSHQLGALAGVGNQDVVTFDGTSYRMFFHGSDLGLAGVNLDAFALLDPTSLVMSFATPVVIPGLGLVAPSDVVRFNATSLGDTTAGTFSWYFDGSDVGLTQPSEAIDALAVLPDGRLLVSTLGSVRAKGVVGAGQDLMAFTPSSLGHATKGTWATYFDGSDVGLTTRSEGLDAVSVKTDGTIVLSTRGGFAVSGISGSGVDAFSCTPVQLGLNTTCDFAPALFFKGHAHGLGGLGLDALEIP